MIGIDFVQITITHDGACKLIPSPQMLVLATSEQRVPTLVEGEWT